MSDKFNPADWVPALRVYEDGTPTRTDVYIHKWRRQGWYTVDWEQDNPGMGSSHGQGWSLDSMPYGRFCQQVSLARLLYSRSE